MRIKTAQRVAKAYVEREVRRASMGRILAQYEKVFEGIARNPEIMASIIENNVNEGRLSVRGDQILYEGVLVAEVGRA